MLKYVKSIADLDQINVAAKRLSDTPPRVVKKKGLHKKNSNGNSDDEKEGASEPEEKEFETEEEKKPWKESTLACKINLVEYLLVRK